MTKNVKKACFFHSILIGVSFRLIQSVKGLLINSFRTSLQDLSANITPSPLRDRVPFQDFIKF